MEVWCRRGPYRGSTEELTPVRHDPVASVPLVTATVATLVRPSWWTWFTSGSVGNYALTPGAWDEILRMAAGPARPAP